MSSIQFVGDLLKAFSKSFEPLEHGLQSGDGLAAFLADFGWVLDPSEDISPVVASLGSVPSDLTAIRQAVADFDNASGAEAIANAVGKLVTAIEDLVHAIRTLAQITPGTIWPAPFNNPAFWATFPQDLLEYLLYRYLERHAQTLFVSFRFIGVASEDSQFPAGAGRVFFTKRSLRWDRLVAAVSKPGSVFVDVYGWGGAFDAHRLMENFRALGSAFGLPVGPNSAPPKILDMYYDPDARSRKDAYELVVPVYSAVSSTAGVLTTIMVQLAALPIPPAGNKNASAFGFAIYPRVVGKASDRIPISDSVAIVLKGGFVSEGAVRAEIRPTGTKIFVDPTLDARIDASATLDATPVKAWILLGRKGSSRIELSHAHAALKAQGVVPDIEFIVEIAADAAAVVIDFGEGDGFLQEIVGGSPETLELSLGISWSTKKGLQFSGQAELEATLPIHQSIGGVISVDSVAISFRASATNPAAALSVGVSGGFALGPVAASVDRVGLQANLAHVAKGQPAGNLGDANITWAFLPPKGLGLAVDAGVVVGGGYIFCNPEKGEYAGVLELAIEVVQVKIIGILNTILPGGQQGFSLLLIVSAEFEPIQLSFGFTLSGVGGLAGINRTMVLEALRTGLKHHTLNSILFPVDPVAHAAQIISDLQTVFPPQQNRYVFGPMIELGWGTPNLIIAELGVVIELPAPIRLAILGQMTAALPKPAAPVVLIHLDVLGTVEFEKKFLSIDATLYDSRVTVFSLLGDMAMRLLWGDNANFALSVGGLHPKYQPPPAFPSLTRLTLSMGSGDNPRLSCEAYFAVTSNSLQFGAGLSLYASAAGFTLEGHLGFDALFVFSPVFHFAIEISGSIDLKQGNSTLASLNLDMLLEGPNPFHAAGSVSLHILFITISAGFDATWGDPTTVSLPGKNPKEDLLGALNDVRNWNATIPTDAERAASLIAPAPDNKTVVVHPLGNLGVVQKVVPLAFHMARYGSAAPIGIDRFDVSDVTLNGTSMPSTAYHMIPENFSPGQFEDLSENDKLSRASFEPHSAGVQLTSNAVVTGTVMNLDVEYETILVDDPLLTGTPVGLHTVDGATFLAQAGQGAAQFSELRNTGKRKFLDPDAPDGTVRLGHVKYIVSSKKDLSVRRDIADDGNFSSVQQSMAAYLKENPAEREDLQVTPSHQTARV